MHDLKAIFDPDHGQALPTQATPISTIIEGLVDASIGPDDLPDDLRDAYEERAAIMEHHGGVCRERAEAAALVETIQRIGAERAPLTRPPGGAAHG